MSSVILSRILFVSKGGYKLDMPSPLGMFDRFETKIKAVSFHELSTFLTWFKEIPAFKTN